MDETREPAQIVPHASFAKGKQASAEAGPARPLVVRSGHLPNVV